jgi:hypothetical protein
MKVVNFCRREVTRLVGTLDGEALEKFLDAMIEGGEKNSAVDCVIFASEQRLPESLAMAKKLSMSFDLVTTHYNLYFVTDEENKEATMFVPDKHFQPDRIFLSKAKAYPRVRTFRCYTLWH